LEEYAPCVYASITSVGVQVGKKEVGVSNLSHSPQAPRVRNPTRHATGEKSLQSETSLKDHLQLLKARTSIAGYPCEWAATAAFGLGAVGGDLNVDGAERRRQLRASYH
jgi:hypothetical protein